MLDIEYGAGAILEYTRDASKLEPSPSSLSQMTESSDLGDLASDPSLRTAVIVSTYNREAFLGEALRSLRDQTLPPARLIVVDDGSTDGTAAVVESFGPEVEYRRQPNSGKAAALNLALADVVEPLVWVFDDDDVAAPDALERLTRALASRPDCDFAFGDYDMFRDHPTTKVRAWSRAEIPEFEEPQLFASLLERSFVFQGEMLVRRSAYAAVGPFDESLIRSQDYEMVLRLARHHRGVRVSGVLFHQRQHDGPRGTSARPILANQIEDGWRTYDEQIFRRLHAELALDEYVGGDAASDEDRTRLALARRCVVYARKNLWDLAAESLVHYVALASERSAIAARERDVFARIFDIYSRAEIRGSERFLNVVATLRPMWLRAQLRASILAPLNYRLRLAIKRRSRAEIIHLARTFARLSNPASLMLHVRSTVQRKIARSAQQH